MSFEMPKVSSYPADSMSYCVNHTELLELLHSFSNMLEHALHCVVGIATALYKRLEDRVEEILACVLGAVYVYGRDCDGKSLV